jgi:sulfur relay (sulfurtransferase) DsrC/TusE family protein
LFFILNQNNSRWKLHQIIHFFHLSGQQSKSIQDISPEYRTTVKAYTRHITRIQDNSQSLYKPYHHNTGQQSKPIHAISPEYRTTVKAYTSHITIIQDNSQSLYTTYHQNTGQQSNPIQAILLNLGGSVYGVWVLVIKLNLTW